MRKTLWAVVVPIFMAVSQFAVADVSGSWTFAVTLGQLGSGNAAVTMNQEAEGKLSGTYSGQLGQTAISGTWEGSNFEVTISSEALGMDVIYKGTQAADDTLSGTVTIQGQEAGTFTAAKS